MQIVRVNRFHFDSGFMMNFHNELFVKVTKKNNLYDLLPIAECEFYFQKNGYVEIHVPEQIYQEKIEFFETK